MRKGWWPGLREEQWCWRGEDGFWNVLGHDLLSDKGKEGTVTHFLASSLSNQVPYRDREDRRLQ